MEQTNTIQTATENDKLDINITVKKLLKFALPTIISMIMMNVYGTVDGMFVSNLISTDALSSLAIVSPIFGVVFAISMMLGTGGTAVVAKKLGEGKETEARRNFTLIICVSILLGITVTVIGYVFIEPLIYLLGANDDIFKYCYDYMIVFIAFFTPCFLNIIVYSFLIVSGKARLGLILSTAGGVFNIIFDYVFIAPAGMGISGAALATGIGYTITPVVGLMLFVVSRKGSLYIVRPKWDGRMLLKSCGNGASEMISNLSGAIVTFLFNITLMSMAGIGQDGVSAITIIFYAMNLLISAYFGYVIGISPIISYNYGKQDTQRLRRTYTISLRVLLIAALAAFAVSQIFAEGLVSLFASSNPAVFGMAVNGYRIFSICFLFMGFNIFASSMFTALSDGVTSAILSVFRTLIFVVTAILTLPIFFGINGVWIAMPAAELAAFGMTIFFFKRNKKKFGY